MFEKEAKEYCNALIQNEIKVKSIYDIEVMQKDLEKFFQDGAEFGYNKANEWQYPSKGELPKDNSFVLVWTIDGGITTNYGKEYSDGIPENGLFQGIHISDVIAWKEIVLPKESE